MLPKSVHLSLRTNPPLLTGTVLVLLAIFAGLFVASLPGYRVGTIDEPWIAEQAYYLASEGTVRSEMFTGYAANESRIFVYHKLLVWLGALSVKLTGLNLWLLRSISLVSCLALFGLMYRHLSRARAPGRFDFLVSALVLFSCPLFFSRIFIFRPEFLVTLCGFASYFFLSRFIAQKSRLYLMASATLAGLAVLSHLNGLIFIAAGIVLLLFQRDYLSVLIFGMIAVGVSGFYLVDCLGHFDQLVNQFTSSPGNHTASLNPVNAIANLMEEHKRLFRRADIIGISLLYFMSLVHQRINFGKLKTPRNIYTLALIIALGLVSSNKTPTYAIMLFPFFAIPIASSLIQSLIGRPSGRFRLTLPITFALYLGFGLYTNANTAFSAGEYVETRNAAVAVRLKPGSIVLTPLKFMFNQIDQFELRSLEAANLIMAKTDLPMTFKNLNQYARKIGAEYILLDCDFESDFEPPASRESLKLLSQYPQVDSVAGYLILSRSHDIPKAQ